MPAPDHIPAIVDVAPLVPITSAAAAGPSARSTNVDDAADEDMPPGSTAKGMPAFGRTPARPSTSDDVILLDRVSANAPSGETPRRSESASGGVVVVATGNESDRVRKLCNANNLLVPVMSSLAIAHEALSVVVIGEPSPPAPDRVVHVVRPQVSDAQLLVLLRALVSGHVVAERPTVQPDGDRRIIEHAQRIAPLEDRAAIETATVEALGALLAADRVHCLFFDPSTGALWSESQRRTLGDDRKAMGGLAGWAAWTGEALAVSPVGDDARWLAEVDDPDGKAQSRILVQPIIGGDQRVHAVLVAVRRWRQPAFLPEDIATLRQFAALAAPVLDIIAASPSSSGATASSSGTGSKPPAPKPFIPPFPTNPPAPQPPPPMPAPVPPPAPAPGAPSDGAGDSRATRVPTRQPPSTSTTGRTRAPSSSGASGSMRAASAPVVRANRIAVVAVGGEQDRAKRVAKMCALDVTVHDATDAAPADARVITIGQTWSPELDPRVAYVARTTIANDHLADLMSAVATGRGLSQPPTVIAPANPHEARRAQLAFTGSRSFAAADDFAAADGAAVATLREVLDADRAYFLVYDDATGALYSPARRRTRGDDRRSIAGIAGWVALTGLPANAERAATDPRWLGPIDDPDGDPNSQLLLQPIVRADQRVLGVLIAARRPRRAGFSELDTSMMARFASLLPPLVEQLTVHAETQRLIGDDARGASTTSRPSTASPSPWKRLRAKIRGLLDD